MTATAAPQSIGQMSHRLNREKIIVVGNLCNPQAAGKHRAISAALCGLSRIDPSMFLYIAPGFIPPRGSFPKAEATSVASLAWLPASPSSCARACIA